MIDPDRILEGVVRTLEEAVLPELAGGFARGQLYAVLEVLAGVQGQLVWGGFLLENEATRLAELFEEVAASVGGELADRLNAYAGLSSQPLAERLREGRALVCALIEEGYCDEGPVAAAIDGFLASDTIAKAMALRPTRLAEISQG